MDSWHRRPVVVALAIGYLIGLAVLVGGPWGYALNRFTVACYVLFRYQWPIAPDWALPEHYGMLLNVVLFVPLGIALVVLARMRWFVASLVAVLGSVAIEVTQGVFLAREGTVSDVVTNTIGAVIGAVGASAALTLRRRRRR